MKIQPVSFKNISYINNFKSNFKLKSLPFDSFEKINFKGNGDKFYPAKTISEAIEYGKNTFKIKVYKGFDENSLDTLNWFNEGLFNLKKIMKRDFYPPTRIVYSPAMDMDTAIEVNDNDLWLSKKAFEADSEFIKKHIMLSDLPDEVKKEKLSLNLTYLVQEYDLKNNKDFVMKSPYSLVYHEMGHIQHRNNLGQNLFGQILKSPKNKLSKTAQEFVNLFNKNKKTVASKVSKYATENVLEFVAETFTGLCEGVKYDNKVMDLYRKLGGVEV